VVFLFAGVWDGGWMDVAGDGGWPEMVNWRKLSKGGGCTGFDEASVKKGTGDNELVIQCTESRI
jgi:hypothetical protein